MQWGRGEGISNWELGELGVRSSCLEVGSTSIWAAGWPGFLKAIFPVLTIGFVCDSLMGQEYREDWNDLQVPDGKEVGISAL